MTIICSQCGGPCTGEVLKVQDKHYHINCFKCEECGILLASGGYFPRNNRYYCSKDYHRLFGTCCKSCGEFVEGRVITALGNSYHPHCFTCDRCGGEIRSGTVVTYNDKEEILCQKCSPDVSLSESNEGGGGGGTSPSSNVSVSSTTTSNQRIKNTPSPVESPPKDTPKSNSGRPYLSSNQQSSTPKSRVSNSISNSTSTNTTTNTTSTSTTTATTSTNNSSTNSSTSSNRSKGNPNVLDDVFDFSKVPDIDPDTQPYLGKCAQCNEVIRSAQSLIALNRHWHLFCFCCARCKRYLTNEYMDNGDQAYCEPCFQELYGLICETCQQYITGAVLEAGDRHFHPGCAFCCKCNLKFTEGDDLCLSGDEVWHLDCQRAARSATVTSTSLPPSESNKIKTRPSSENYYRGSGEDKKSSNQRYIGYQSPIPSSVSRSSSRSSSRMTPEIHPIEFYPLKDLQLIGKVCLPKGVNRTKLEQHLNDSDFFDVFGMDRQAFYCKPQWKQLELKKKANLF